MVRAVYPGSFDPITLGHLDIITRASKLFDEVVMAVVANPGKNPLLPIDVRAELISRVIGDMPGVTVDTFQGLTVDFAKNKQISVIIRGLRAVSDYEAELSMAQTNKQLLPELETIFLMTKAEYSFISSSTVKEIVKLGGDVTQFLPPAVNLYLKEHHINFQQGR
ncbi:MAG: pantetheine-phosphate adenylyltransferase [Candidatus Obscuribacterales bacterium]|nr:pantetheine-phosphate adenylyltransferase [Candidatus Obscuribacterales bacterium]